MPGATWGTFSSSPPPQARFRLFGPAPGGHLEERRTRVTERFHREYFEELYGRSEDPWKFATSEYEQRKYRQTLAALEGRRFRQALEAGCSIGVFTAMLAPYCDELLAVDTSERAVGLARERLSGSRHVRLERRTLPEEAPEGPFDLIVASEFLYYLTEDLMLATLRRFEPGLAGRGRARA